MIWHRYCPFIAFAGHNIAQQGKNNLILIYFYFHSFVFSSTTKLSYVLSPLRRLGEISIYVNRSKYNTVFVKTFIFRYNFAFTQVDIIFLHFKNTFKFGQLHVIRCQNIPKTQFQSSYLKVWRSKKRDANWPKCS